MGGEQCILLQCFWSGIMIPKAALVLSEKGFDKNQLD